MSVATVDEMAKKISKPTPKIESEGSARKPMVVQVRGSEAWKDWVDRMASKNRDTVAQLVDRALTEFAKNHGFEDPPER